MCLRPRPCYLIRMAKKRRSSSKPRSAGRKRRPSLADTRAALAEIDAFFRRTGKVVMALTVQEILDEEIAKELA